LDHAITRSFRPSFVTDCAEIPKIARINDLVAKTYVDKPQQSSAPMVGRAVFKGLSVRAGNDDFHYISPFSGSDRANLFFWLWFWCGFGNLFFDPQ
jgi:hypothetical protein